jgi:hypothetical protein
MVWRKVSEAVSDVIQAGASLGKRAGKWIGSDV